MSSRLITSSATKTGSLLAASSRARIKKVLRTRKSARRDCLDHGSGMDHDEFHLDRVCAQISEDIRPWAVHTLKAPSGDRMSGSGSRLRSLLFADERLTHATEGRLVTSANRG